MTSGQLVSGEDAAAARAALDRLVASETFRGSPQLAAFLRFVVETTLRGESARLKGYTIGVEALGRADDFDPQIDPIVRVEATRLRRTLERYYAGPGAADPIVFEMTRGSYVPAIRRRDTTHDAAVPAPGRLDIVRGLARSRLVLVPLAALAAAGVIVGSIVALRYEPAPERRAAAPNLDFDAPLQAGNGMPTLVVQAPQILRGASSTGADGSALIDKVRATFARFDTVNVVIEQPGAAPGAAKAAARANYRLVSSGEFHADSTATARFRLLDSDGDRVIWSRSFERLPNLGTGETEDKVVRQLATTLLQPFGVIRANEWRKHLAGANSDPRRRCILEASESFRSFDNAQHALARTCLERLTERDPSFALGFAYLAAVYMRAHQYHQDAGGTDLLDRALRIARQAVELSPETARTYQMLATVLFARHDLPGAFAAAERAIALNPYDMTILSDYGGRLVASGEVDRGMAILNRSAEEGTVRPSWYQFYMFLGAYLKNDMRAAAHHAGLITTEAFPLGFLAKALVAAADGNQALARKTYDQLVALRAPWRDRPRDELSRLFPTATVVGRLARDLENAGLAPPRP